MDHTSRRLPIPAVIAVVLVVFALLATCVPFVVRNHAAAACDMLERMGGLALLVAGVLLFALNLVVTAVLWLMLRHQGGLGVAGALVIGFVVFTAIAVGFLVLTAVPAGYPTPPWSCPGGHPTWWPDLLPG